MCYTMGNGSPDDENPDIPPWPDAECGYCGRTAFQILLDERSEGMYEDGLHQTLCLAAALDRIGYEPQLSFERCYHESERNVLGCDDKTPPGTTVSVSAVREFYCECAGFMPTNSAPEHCADGRLDHDEFKVFCFFAEQPENQEDYDSESCPSSQE
mmetsp:Transcript_21220/g.41314  ORF Transcript_21220/g.41314 Transcript_21220/m.41314 type:complete len:156 (+) Transcript_21220:505-972(+)